MPPSEVCPQCGAQLPERSLEELADLRDAPELLVGGRSWNEWRAAPLSDWLELPAEARPAGRRRLN